MVKNISKENVRRAVIRIMHPVIERNLGELGIIKDISVNAENVNITMALPFVGISDKDISIREQVVNSVREAIKKLGGKIELKQTEMDQAELQAFLAMERETWKSMV